MPNTYTEEVIWDRSKDVEEWRIVLNPNGTFSARKVYMQSGQHFMALNENYTIEALLAKLQSWRENG